MNSEGAKRELGVSFPGKKNFHFLAASNGCEWLRLGSDATWLMDEGGWLIVGVPGMARGVLPMVTNTYQW